MIKRKEAIRRLEEVVDRARVQAFPATRALCQRGIGAWEAVLTVEDSRVRVDKTAPVVDGSSCCEMRAVLDVADISPKTDGSGTGGSSAHLRRLEGP